MRLWYTELKAFWRKKFPPYTWRSYVCFIVVILIFVNSSSMLEALGFGDGRSFSTVPQAILSAFWAGGMSVAVVQMLVLVELALRKLLR